VTHRELADIEEVVDGVVPRGEEHNRELASGGDEQHDDDELAEPVADDRQLPAEVEVLPEDAIDADASLLDVLEQRPRKVLKVEPLEVADEAEQHTGEEVHGAAVCGLGGEAGGDEGREEAEGEGEARGVVDQTRSLLVRSLSEIEEAVAGTSTLRVRKRSQDWRAATLVPGSP
jgi:hypothetical protein